MLLDCSHCSTFQICRCDTGSGGLDCLLLCPLHDQIRVSACWDVKIVMHSALPLVSPSVSGQVRGREATNLLTLIVSTTNIMAACSKHLPGICLPWRVFRVMYLHILPSAGTWPATRVLYRRLRIDRDGALLRALFRPMSSPFQPFHCRALPSNEATAGSSQRYLIQRILE